MEYKGSVSVCVFSQVGGLGQRFCIWVMRHEGGTESWTKQFNFELKDTLRWPLKLTRNGKFIMESREQVELRKSGLQKFIDLF